MSGEEEFQLCPNCKVGRLQPTGVAATILIFDRVKRNPFVCFYNIMFLFYADCQKLDRMLSMDTNVDVSSLIMQAEEDTATILGRTTEEMIRPYAQYLIFGIDIATGIVIAISAAMALIGFLRVITTTRHAEHHTIDKETIRLRLARGMLLAIDLQVGAVILKAIIVPSIQELAMLAAIVGIKVVVGWSLSKEVNSHHDQRARFEERQKRSMDTKSKADSAGP